MEFSKLNLTSLALAVPLLFWTLTPNFLSTPKELIVILSATISLIYLLHRALTQNTLSLPSLKNSLPLLLLGLATIATVIANPEGRPEVLSSKGTVIIALCLITAHATTFAKSHWQKNFQLITLLLGAILSIHSLLSLTFLSRSTFMPPYMQNLSFTPTGSYLTTLVLILASLILALSLIKTVKNKTPLLLLLVANSISVVAIISLMIPGGALNPTFLPLTASWSIALDALKSMRSLLFGIGLSNYSLLFTSVKPLSLNSTSLWNTLPSTGSSELLTLLPTGGIILTLSFLYFFYRTLVNSLSTPYLGLAFLIFLSFLLLPVNLPIYLLLFLLYAVTSPTNSNTIPLSVSTRILTTMILVSMGFAIAYPTTKSYLSEFFMRRAQLGLEAGDSQKVYQNHLKAIRFSPKTTNYHLSFADVNFRLASALSQKENLSDTDRSTITSLIQQSIQSGKAAITLRPNDSRTWLTVAKIYQNLINVAEGSDKFAIESYNRAINLDRANPSLRVDYAGLLSQLASSQKEATLSASYRSRAISELQTAIQLKNDYANAYYNLAKIFESANNQELAIQALQETQKYLPSDSNEYSRLTSEIEALKNKKSTDKTSPTSDTLATPSPLPSPINGGPVSLPTE